MIELLVVLVMISVLVAYALPQIVAQRRLSRSVSLTSEILTQLRETRQLAMSQRQAFTFQYDDRTKRISIIDHNSNPGPSLLIDATYPLTPGSNVVLSAPIAESALSSEISYGIPTGLPNGALADGTPMTALVNNQVNITFQPDGSVIDAAGNPIGRAMFFYNRFAQSGTASAISVMGASGRVKIWRYNWATNSYVE